MTVSSTLQLMTLLWGVAAGAICGALSGVMGAVKSELRPCRALSMLGDLLFWIFAGAAMVWLNLRLGDGSVRLYQIPAAICGFILYVLCLGRPTQWLTAWVLRGLKLILSPVFFLCRGLRLYMAEIINNIGNIFAVIKRNFKRSTSVGKVRKKFQKNYKKML